MRSSGTLFTRHSYAHDLRVKFSGKKPPLSSYLKKCIPELWLAEHYPALLNKQSDCIQYAPIDGICRYQYGHGQVHAMALAALFEDQNHALNEFFSGTKNRGTGEDRKKMRRISERKKLLTMYIQHGGHALRIAEESQKHLANTCRKLRSVGLASLGHFYKLR